MASQEQTEIHVFDDLLTTALKQRGCPICMILQNKTNDLMCKLQFEAVHNQEFNALLLSVGGYCHFHFWYLEKLASPVTNAQLLEDLLGKIERECMKNTSGEEAAVWRSIRLSGLLFLQGLGRESPNFLCRTDTGKGFPRCL